MSCTTTKVSLSACGIDAVARDGIGADDVERGEFAAARGVEDLEHVEAGLGGRVVLGEGAGAGRQGCSRGACRAAGPCRPRRASWRSRQSRANFAPGRVQAEVDEPLEVCAAELGAEEDEQLLFGADGVAEVAEARRRLRGMRADRRRVVSGEVSWRARRSRTARCCDEGFGLAAKLDLGGVGDVEARRC